MAQLTLTSKDAVLAACAQFDELGRDAFLRNHGFGKAREYFLFHNGNHYDSKAIAGVAWGIEHGDNATLAASAFSGGEQTVGRLLRSLGFTVVRSTEVGSLSGALVLVENEVTFGGKYDFWADDTGVEYQFPNSYKNRIRPGRPFVYYRGVRRAHGKRGSAEYFGTGVIGDVWQDPSQPPDTRAANRRWFCAIENYVPFDVPVPSKRDGVPYEQISNSLGWRTGAREIPLTAFNAILDAANLVLPRKPGLKKPPAEATLTIVEDPSQLFLKRPRSSSHAQNSSAGGRSDRAVEIGCWAEEQVYRWLQCNLPASCQDSVDWPAHREETPGWDICYKDEDGQLIAVEVKATTLTKFSSLELTANEWRAAQELGSKYIIALVAGAFSPMPRISLLKDPTALLKSGTLSVEPVSFRVSMIEESGLRSKDA